MTVDLSLRAKRLLCLQYRNLLIVEESVAQASSTLTEILTWCDDFEFAPGRWITPKKSYRFNRDYIAQINQTLLDVGYASIFDDFSQDTHQSAAQRNPYEKQGKLKPTHHLILAAFTDGGALAAINQYFYPNQQLNIELDVARLKLDTFDSLVVVENRDSFNDWFKYKDNASLPNPLVIYRGDQHHSTACKTLLRSWLNIPSNKPAIYFGDFDLAGLRIAASAGYSHLLLPESSWLTQQVIKPHYPDNQQKYLARLARECPKGWLPLFKLMREKRAGLRQQKMYSTPLILYSVEET